jgi:hypothetical protein
MSYESELREALQTLSVHRMRALDRRWELGFGEVDHAEALALMHKLRLFLKDIPDGDRDFSRRWLATRGVTESLRLDDGRMVWPAGHDAAVSGDPTGPAMPACTAVAWTFSGRTAGRTP